MNPVYLETARLLTQVAPFVFVDDEFALKGGTAINLFLRDMPRLSVDLDLVFIDHTATRVDALTRINAGIRATERRLQRRGFEVFVPEAVEEGEARLMVRHGAMQVKVEINPVMRGAVHPARRSNMTALARDTLLADLEIPILSPEDVYGGKLVAALDRQHPRDLFDVMELYAHGGITAGIRRAFVVYLASHNRPVHEVLFPQMHNLELEFERNFAGMTAEPVELAALIDVRDRMTRDLQGSLDADERQFLLSVVQAEPDWQRMGIPHLERLPAIRWKLQNLARLREARPEQFKLQHTELAARLDH